jgi:amino acid permease
VLRKKKANLHFIGYTLLIYLVIVGVSVGVDDIEAVFNVIGAICSSSIGILLPCFFYFRLVVKKRKARTLKYYVALVIFAVMAPYCLFSIVALYVNS